MNLISTNAAHTRARTEHHVQTRQVARFFLRVTLNTGSAVALKPWFSVVILVLFLGLKGRFSFRMSFEYQQMSMHVRALMVSAVMSVK